MSEKIEPALSAEEWARKREDGLDLYDDFVSDRPGSGPRIIAAINDDLPDDDSRKITREWVIELRRVAQAFPSLGELREIAAMADALESYLPPESGT